MFDPITQNLPVPKVTCFTETGTEPIIHSLLIIAPFKGLLIGHAPGHKKG